MTIDSKLDSSEYKCKLSEHLTELLKKTKSAENEAQTAQAFHDEIYFFNNTRKLTEDELEKLKKANLE